METTDIIYSCGPRKLARVLLDTQLRASQSSKERLLTRSTTTYHSQTPTIALPSPDDPRSLVHRNKSEIAANAPDVLSPLVSTAMPNSTFSPKPTPLSQAHAATLSATPSPPATQTEASSYFPPRVLLVDDNAINLKLLVVFAKRQNLPYTEATDGLKALTSYKDAALSTEPASQPFDFVLMDLQMPVMDGLEATRQIRLFEAEKELPRTTIIALTGLASAQDQQDAIDAGVDMYLVKPVKFADIRRLFGR
jgi:CheY-like chemotaxis protein